MNEVSRVSAIVAASIVVFVLEAAAFQGLKGALLGAPPDMLDTIGYGVVMGSLPLGGMGAVRAVLARKR